MSGDDHNREGLLRRWSRLKQAERERAREPATPAEAAKPVAVPADDETAPATPADELPDIDSLDKDSDFTVFLKEEVPEALQRLALRKLWLSDPVLANLDGLNDYDEDFTVYFKGAQEIFRAAAKSGDELQGPDTETESQAAAEPGEEVGSASAKTPAEPAEAQSDEDLGDDKPSGASET